LVTVRLHNDSFLASTPLDRRILSLENVIHSAADRDGARLARKRDEALHNVYFAGGVSAFRLGRVREARGLFLRAWRRRPRDAAALAYVGLSWLGPRTSSLLLRIKHHIVPGHRRGN
jgi:hypothetical protein